MLCLLRHGLIPDALGMLFLPSAPIPATLSAPSVAVGQALCVWKWSGGRVPVLQGCPTMSGRC